MAMSVDQDYAKWMNVKDIHQIMASKPEYKTILFSDGKTKLIDYLSALKNPKKYEKFLNSITDINVSLPSNSPLWPGSTPLHLAVMFSANVKNEDKAVQLVSHCLNRGALIQVQNQRGATPLHLAFRMEQKQILVLLMRSLEKKSATVTNLMDDDNLSYLHIACALKDHRQSLARKLLLDQPAIKTTVNIPYRGEALSNVKPGWTPLHVSVDQLQYYLVELLLQRDADIFCTDADDSTVIHQLFGTTGTKPLADIFFAAKHLKDCVQASTGLSHLHVAIWFDDVKSVERLLDEGADIETTVKSLSGKGIKKFEGFRPLLMAMILDHVRCVKALLKRGANVLAKKFNNGSSTLSDALRVTYINQRDYVSVNVSQAFISIYWDNDKMQQFLEKELGLTQLHIACYSGNVDKAAALIDQGANVNARVSNISHFWTGYTPLHMLISAFISWSSNKMTILLNLLQANCDIDHQDSAGKTALHLLFLSSLHYRHDVMEVLLSAGADLNIVDHTGKTAISYAKNLLWHCTNEYDRWDAGRLINTLTVLLCKMKLVGIEVCQVNETYLTAVLQNTENAEITTFIMNEFCDQLQKTKKVIIGHRGLTLRSFLFETGAMSMYPSLTPNDRSEVNAFFQSSINNQDSPDWKFLRNLQYRKAVARLTLIDPAVEALKGFIDLGFPDLCVDIILKYLSNSELKVLIAASKLDD